MAETVVDVVVSKLLLLKNNNNKHVTACAVDHDDTFMVDEQRYCGHTTMTVTVCLGSHCDKYPTRYLFYASLAGVRIALD